MFIWDFCNPGPGRVRLALEGVGWKIQVNVRPKGQGPGFYRLYLDYARRSGVRVQSYNIHTNSLFLSHHNDDDGMTGFS